MNEKVVSFFRFAGFGKTAKDLSDQEIVELYKRVKEQLAESSGEENPVLDSSTAGPAPMEDPEVPDFSSGNDLNPDDATQGTDGTEPSQADATSTIDSPELGPSEGSAIQNDMQENTDTGSSEEYDPEQDQELQAMLDELGLGDDEPATENAGETGDVSDASGAPGPIEQSPSTVDESIQVNSSEEPDDLSMTDLKTMFGVSPKVEEFKQEEPVVEAQVPEEKEASVEPVEEGKKDEVATFLNGLGAPASTEEQPPVEEKTACADAIVNEQPLNEIADEFEVVSQPEVGEIPVTSETPDTIAPLPKETQEQNEIIPKAEPVVKRNVSLGIPRQQEVDISDFTVAGKGRIAMRGMQMVRKDKDTMADGITRPDADEGEGIKAPREDLQNPWGADYKKKSENRDPDVDSDKDLKVASIVERFAFEFDSKEALDKYLDQHPKADKNNHWVDETQKKTTSQVQQHAAPVTRNKAQNDAYKTLGDSIKGFFRDTDWSGARSVFKKLQDSGFKIDHLGVDDSDYKVTGGSKRWRANLLHPSGRELNCTVTAHSAGELSDVFGRYDLSVVIQ